MKGKTLTKQDLVERIQEKTERPQQTTKADVEELLSIMKEAIKVDQKLLISNFGKFDAYDKASRLGRNPQTSESITLDPRRVCVFRISKNFKQELNPQGNK